MAGLDDIINLSITIQSSTITQAGFGTPLVLDFNTRYSDVRVRSYSSLASMVTDGFATTDPAYVAVSQMFSQNPRPQSAKVGRRTLGPAQRFELTPATAISTTYKFSMAITGGATQTVQFVSSATANAAEIINGLSAAVAALNGYSAAGLTASNQTTFLRILGPATGPKFKVEAINANFSTWKDTTADAGVATDLNNIELEDADWYGFIGTSKGEDELKAQGAWVQSRRKFFVGGTMNQDVIVSGAADVASYMKNQAYTRSALFWNDGHMDQDDAAFLGRWLPFVPGSESMKFKTLAGVDATKLTDSQLTQLRAKNANFYITVAGTNTTEEGKTCQGEFVDTIRFVDWLYARMQEAIFSVLTTQAKVPFTDPGIAQIESAIRSVLQRGVEAGGLAESPQYTVTVPKAASVDSVNKAARTLPNVTFTGTLAGAIHNLVIAGTVSV